MIISQSSLLIKRGKSTLLTFPYIFESTSVHPKSPYTEGSTRFVCRGGDEKLLEQILTRLKTNFESEGTVAVAATIQGWIWPRLRRAAVLRQSGHVVVAENLCPVSRGGGGVADPRGREAIYDYNQSFLSFILI